MNGIFRKWAYSLAGIIPTPAMVRICGKNLFMPFYHTVSEAALPHIEPLYRCRTAKEFENDLDFLLRHFKPISASEIALLSNSGNNPESPSFHLSFDDGLSGCYHFIAPLLLKKGIPATFFINSGFVDNKSLFYRYKLGLILNKLSNDPPDFKIINGIRELLTSNGLHGKSIFTLLRSINYTNRFLLDQMAALMDLDFQLFLKNEQPYMKYEQLVELNKKGFTIGAHSVNHPFFPNISLRDQISQTLESLDFVRDITGDVGAEFMAFPFSEVGVPEKYYKEVHSERTRRIITFGTTGFLGEERPFHFNRHQMEGLPFSGKSIVNMRYLRGLTL